MAKTGKSFQELEESMLQGQKLQGPQTADEVHKSLEARGAKRKYRNGNRGYPQFEAVWKVCYEVGTFFEMLLGLNRRSSLGTTTC